VYYDLLAKFNDKSTLSMEFLEENEQWIRGNLSRLNGSEDVDTLWLKLVKMTPMGLFA
jgi:hypothetical protein